MCLQRVRDIVVFHLNVPTPSKERMQTPSRDARISVRIGALLEGGNRSELETVNHHRREILMRKLSGPTATAALTGVVLFGALVGHAQASGKETLGTAAGVTVASGSRTVTAHTGMLTQPSSVNFSVPAGAAVKQVLLYWQGQSVYPSPGDDTITVNGIVVTGKLIGGPTILFQLGTDKIQSSRFRADITSLGLIASGANALTLEGLDFNFRNKSVKVKVILANGSSPSGM